MFAEMKFWKLVIYEDFKEGTTNSSPQLIMKWALIIAAFWCCTVNLEFYCDFWESSLSSDTSFQSAVKCLVWQRPFEQERKRTQIREIRGAGIGVLPTWKKEEACSWILLKSHCTILASLHKRCWTSGLWFSKDKMQMKHYPAGVWHKLRKLQVQFT